MGDHVAGPLVDAQRDRGRGPAGGDIFSMLSRFRIGDTLTRIEDAKHRGRFWR